MLSLAHVLVSVTRDSPPPFTPILIPKGQD